MPLALAYPQKINFKIAAKRRLDQLRQRFDQTRLLDDRRFTSATCAPNPMLRRRLLLRRQFLQTTPYRTSGDPGNR
jgi:hypothetical protein